MPGPIFTPHQLIQQNIQHDETQWIGTIQSINYQARTLVVNIKGASGPRVLVVPANLDLGTTTNPRFYAGNQAIVERIDDRYFVRDIWVQAGKSIGTPGAAPNLPAPTNFQVVQQALSLNASWLFQDASQVAYYELYQNTTNGPVGATVTDGGSAKTSGMSYGWSPNISLSSNIFTQNNDFENGLNSWNDITNFAGTPDTITVDSSTVHGGLYSAKIANADGGIIGKYNNFSDGVSPLTAYEFGGYINVTASSGSCPVAIYIYELDVNGAQITNDPTTPSTTATTTSGWVLRKGTFVSRSTVASFGFYILSGPGGTSTAYFDDLYLKNITTASGATLYYAVRAIGLYGQASPFSSWQIPNQQGAQTQRFQSQQFGALVGPEGIDGNIIPPGEKLAKYFFAR